MTPRHSEADTGPDDPRAITLVDCGSSSVRAYVVEIKGQTYRVLEDISFAVDLTTAFSAHHLARQEADRLVEAVTRIRRVASDYDAPLKRMVATSAMREAYNNDVLLDRLQRRLDMEIELIEPAEESRLYYEALLTCLHEDRLRGGPATLMVDVGSGSVNIGLIAEGKLVGSVNEPLGTIRVTRRFGDLREVPDFPRTLDRYVLGSVRRVLSQLYLARPERLAITGNEVRDLTLAVTGSGDERLCRLPQAQLEDWWQGMLLLGPTQRARRCAADIGTADRLLMVASLIRHFCRETGLDHVLVPEIQLRDGLVTDFLPGAPGPYHLDRSHLLAAARQMAERYRVDLAYAENTAALAEQLFDATRELHALGERERNLLSFAAMIHDVGAFINVRNRHTHTRYIVEGSAIPGLSQEDQTIIALTARYHRGAIPKQHHNEFQTRPRHVRVLVSTLAAILRLAYGLDVERMQRIRELDCSLSGGRLLIRTDRRQVTLERWSASRKADFFRHVFGLDVVVLPTEDA